MYSCGSCPRDSESAVSPEMCSISRFRSKEQARGPVLFIDSQNDCRELCGLPRPQGRLDQMGELRKQRGLTEHIRGLAGGHNNGIGKGLAAGMNPQCPRHIAGILRLDLLGMLAANPSHELSDQRIMQPLVTVQLHSSRR